MPTFPISGSLTKEQFWNYHQGEGQPYYSGGPQTQANPYSSQFASLGVAAGGVGAGYGTIKLLQAAGMRPVDHLYAGARIVEDYSPAQVFRTFQTGNWLSQFAESSSKPISISATTISEMVARDSAWFDDLLQRTDYKAQSAITHGIQFRNNSLWAGDTQLFKHARVMTSTGEPHLAAAYARISGANLPGVNDASRLKVPLGPGGESLYFTGADTKKQAFINQGRAFASEWVHRANRLAHAPFELEPISTVWKSVTSTSEKYLNWRPSLSVKSGTATSMIGRMAFKWGGVGTAAYLGYQSADWAVENFSLLDNTIFSEGITAGIATAGIRANLVTAKIADLTPGIRSFQEWQEEAAPGSTSLARLAAFPIMGAVAGATGSYLTTLYTRSRFVAEGMSEGMTLGQAITNAAPKVIEYEEDVARKLFTTKLAKQYWGTSKLPFIGEIGRTKIWSMLGAAAIGSLALPFLPGALIPEKSYEELSDIYSGEQEVEVRKGRLWEMGRCLASHTLVSTSFTESKKAEEIAVGDKLVTAEGTIAQVKNIWSRHHRGAIRSIFTAFDRNLPTSLTGNHRVPVLKKNKNGKPSIKKQDRAVIEIDASEIEVGDFVQIPIPVLGTEIDSLDTLDFLTQFPVFLDGENIFSAQKNWWTDGLQKSGKYFLPKSIELDYELGLLFGYFLAEGNLSYSKGTPSFIETVHSKQELSYARDVVRIAKEKFGIEGSIREKKTGRLVKEGCYVVRLCSSILAKLFFSLFYETGDKSIPGFFLETNISFKEGLVEGYWRGDGYLDEGRKYLTSARLQLLKITQQILLSFGIYSSITKIRAQIYNSKPVFSYRLGWKETRVEEEQYCLWRDGRLYVQVTEISETEFDGTVYDFEIDHAEHLFQAGAFMVHNSDYRGGRISHFRPHWYPRMIQDARTASMHGGDRPFPLAEWFRQNFTYEPELEHYYDRPYPITGAAFEDVPLIGPLLASTIGRIVKPPRLMHTEEWLGEGTGASFSREELASINAEFSKHSNVKHPALAYGENSRVLAPGGGGASISRQQLSIQNGEIARGTPVDPNSLRQMIGEQAYRLTELTGLVGFTSSAIKKQITGSDEWFDQEERLQSARRSYGAERFYWDMELGGVFGASEMFRRLYPHRRRQIPEYNPIRNTMPSWLPSAGDKSPDFQTGDPFIKVPEGEMRLPGEGFATRFPELQGIDPEDYPLAYRYKILSDIAPYSKKTSNTYRQLMSQARRGRLSDRELSILGTARDQLEQARDSRTNFYEYEVLRGDSDLAVPSLGAAQSRELLALANKRVREGEVSPRGVNKLVRGYWEGLIAGARNPLEALTPIAPGSKLIAMETAIQNYERTQVFGSEIAFWETPIDSFIKPFFRETGAALGYSPIPEETKRERQITEYFDILEYVKNKRLAEQARNAGEWGLAKHFTQKSEETSIGINPYDRNFSSIFRSLPRKERNYFEAFVQAKTSEDRARILELVPANLRRTYESQWELQYADSLRSLMAEGSIPESLQERAWEEVSNVFAKRRSAGFPINEELLNQYQEERETYDGDRYESYANWYRRSILIPEALSDSSLPGPDWVGWSPAIDLQDIKLRIVKSEGLNIHDFDLWASDERKVIHRPYVDEAAQELQSTQIAAQGKSPEEVRREVQALLDELGIAGQVNVHALQSDREQYSFQIEASEDRTEDLRQIIKQRYERIG